MRLRTGLWLLAAAAAAPLLVFALLAAVFAFDQERDSFIATSQARNRAVLAAVDSELLGSVYVLRSLARSAALERNDFESFHQDANATLSTQPSWQNVVLQRADGAQLTNARIPLSRSLPQNAIDLDSLRSAVENRKPAFGNVTRAPLLDNEPGITVRLPVLRGDEVAYVLSAVLSASSFQRILEDQSLPKSWVSGLVGTDGKIIARVPSVPAGSPASSDYLVRVKAARDGWYRGKTLEGADTFTAFSQSDLTGWTIGYAMPVDVILGSSRRAATLMIMGVWLSVISAALIAFWLSQRIAKPMSILAESARFLSDGKPWRPVPSDLEEVRQLSVALAAAAEAIKQRDQELAGSHDVLQQQASALRRADANRATFLALISHELRNFLAPLKAGLTVLSKGGDDASLDKTRTMMRSQVNSMARLVDDLIDMGRIDRGELEVRHEQIDINDVLSLAADVAAPSIEAKSQTLQITAESRKLLANGDAIRLGQVFTNLLTNASKYTPERGRIDLTVRGEQKWIEVAVVDSGAGFDPANSGRIFEMFVRLDDTKNHHIAGLGLGLTIAKSIVEAHSGKISAVSAGVGRGATFTVVLPRLPE